MIFAFKFLAYLVKLSAYAATATWKRYQIDIVVPTDVGGPLMDGSSLFSAMTYVYNTLFPTKLYIYIYIYIYMIGVLEFYKIAVTGIRTVKRYS